MQTNWKAEGRRRFLLFVAIVALAAGIFIIPSQFKSQAGKKETKTGLFKSTSSHEEGLENYDIREDVKNESVAEAFVKYRQNTGKDSAVVADIRAGFASGEEDLKSRLPHARVEYNNDIRTPEVITPNVWDKQISWLSSSSTAKRSEILRGFVKENNSLIGVSDEQADSLKVTADYTNPDGNLSYAHLEQLINGVPVFRGEVKAGFTKDGRIIRVINNLAAGLDYSSLSADFGNPVDAVRAAAGFSNYELKPFDTQFNAGQSTDIKAVFGNGDWATTAEKMYFPTEPGVAVPAWRVLIWKPVQAYYVIVDTEGRMLWRKNITADQTQSATYQVYRNSNAFVDVADSPAPLSPGPLDPTTGTQGTLLTRQNVTLVGNEAPNTFNNNGWITDGGNTTDGNAVEAGIDRDGTNGVDAPVTGNPNRVFDSTWNPAPGSPTPGDDPLTAQAQRGAVIQMFYAMNRYHDELYKVGFTEQARNFQASNFGRGGSEADRVSAEGQDSSGTNNANFSTPADGGRGRMQMYVWTGPTPDYDGTADAEVIYHEVTHGTSNRLHGNGSGLGTNFSGGMGEGWSDWYAEIMLSEPTDPINGIYTTGGYATYLISAGFTGNYYYGIRRFPRAPITFLGPNGKPHNPYTFKYLNADCNTLIGTTTSNPPPNSAFPRGPIGVTQCDQVHNVGEVWSSLLWEVRNRMVARLGHTAGTRRVLQVVTDGMKLAPLQPNFLQERDAIIAAAAALPIAPEATADVADVREGFRVRGAGFSASVQSASPIAVTEAFDVPNAIFGTTNSVSDSTGDNDGFPEPGESVTVSIPVTNNSGNGAINNVAISITGGGTVNYGTVNDGATVTNSVPYTVPANATCGSLHTVTITGTTALGAMNPRTFTFRLGAPVGGAPVTVTGGAVNNPGTGTTGDASPYPSTVSVSGLSGQKKIVVELTGLNTTYPGDMDWLLVSPTGQKFLFMSDALSSFTTQTNANVVFKDDAAAVIPTTGSNNLNGEWKPTNVDTTTDVFAAPAPGAPYENPGPAGTATFASAFGTDGSTMNGTWSLYGRDDVSGDVATITGWKITFESDSYNCSLAPTAVKSRADYDGDGKTDLSVFRPSTGDWFVQRSTAGLTIPNWGVATDITTPGDFDGDGKADEAVFRPSTGQWFILQSSNAAPLVLSVGTNGDVPVAADYDGDGKTDAAVFRNGSWIIRSSLTSTTSTTAFGTTGDLPVRADYNNDGKADIAIFRPASGEWWISNSGGSITVTAFGINGDKPVPADYDGDNKEDIAVFRAGTWYILRSTGGVTISTFGLATDVPTPGDYDGDGKDDIAVYRAGAWWVSQSTSGLISTTFGAAADIPTPSRYVP